MITKQIIIENILKEMDYKAGRKWIRRHAKDLKRETEEFPEGSIFTGCEGTTLSGTIQGVPVCATDEMVGIDYCHRVIYVGDKEVSNASYSF